MPGFEGDGSFCLRDEGATRRPHAASWRVVNRWLIVAIAAALLVVPSLEGDADAHPSAANTLTVDLLLDRGGLVLIDAAAHHATDDDAPTPDQRSQIALAVLDALGVPRNHFDIEPEKSLLYHEVGFTIWLLKPFRNTTVDGEVHIDTRALQAVATRNSFGQLTLDVCRVGFPDQTLSIVSDVAPGAPDPWGPGAPGTDRLDCGSWTLQTGDAPVSITARSTLDAPESGPGKSVRLPCGEPGQPGDPSLIRYGPSLFVQSAQLHARATGSKDPSGRLVADAIMYVQESTRVELIVPPAWRGRLTLGSRDGERANTVVVPRCRLVPRYGWDGYVNRIWINRPACAPIVVKTANAKRTIHIPIGARCP